MSAQWRDFGNFIEHWQFRRWDLYPVHKVGKIANVDALGKETGQVAVEDRRSVIFDPLEIPTGDQWDTPLTLPCCGLLVVVLGQGMGEGGDVAEFLLHKLGGMQVPDCRTIDKKRIKVVPKDLSPFGAVDRLRLCAGLVGGNKVNLPPCNG